LVLLHLEHASKRAGAVAEEQRLQRAFSELRKGS